MNPWFPGMIHEGARAPSRRPLQTETSSIREAPDTIRASARSVCPERATINSDQTTGFDSTIIVIPAGSTPANIL